MSKVLTRSRVVVAAAGCVALVAGGAALGLSGSAQAAGASAAEQRNVQVWLTPDIAGATAFADAASTPGGPGFHHYLSPNTYTARFGPSAARAKAVSDWLSSVGMTQVRVSSGRDYVSATGDPAKVKVPASLAPDVSGVTGIGEDGTPGAARAAASSRSASRQAAAPTCSQYWGQHVQSYQPAYQGLTKGSLPICGYSAAQMRAAYGATSANTGKGVTVALTEDSTPTAMFATLTDYAKANHLSAPRRDQFREVQGGAVCVSASTTAAADRHAAAASADSATSGPPVDDEAEMDSEAVYALAPDADQLMIVGGGCDQGLLDAALTVLTGDGNHPSATIESNSWQIPVGTEPAPVMHAIDLRAAAEGVGAYFASGDTPGLTMPASDPYATAVGGTTLGIGAHNERVFETGWSSDQATLDSGTWTDSGISSAGGGTSPDYAQPAYQKDVVPASMSQIRVGDRTVTGRAVPDLAADGDPDTGMLVGYIQQGTDAKPGPYQSEPNAGTSLATPLVAALVADAQQGRPTAFGFINPLLYRLSGSAAVRDVLPPAAATAQQDRDSYTPASDGLSPSVDVFGVTTPGAGQQVLAKGHDTLTGLGTPNGGAFIDGLRKAAGR